MEAAVQAVAAYERQRAPLCNVSVSSTISPGHQAILDQHAQSQSNAIIYVAVVLLIYAIALLIVTLQYVRSERSAIHRGSIYQSYLKRERTSSKKRYAQPAPSNDSPESPVKNFKPLIGATTFKVDEGCMV